MQLLGYFGYQPQLHYCVHGEEAIEPAELPERRIDHRRDRRRIGHVGDVRRRFAAGRFDHRHRLFGIGAGRMGVDHHRGARLGERALNRAADDLNALRFSQDQRLFKLMDDLMFHRVTGEELDRLLALLKGFQSRHRFAVGRWLSAR